MRDCIAEFAKANDEDDCKAIEACVRDECVEGEIECDGAGGSVVSKADGERGRYVLCWKWITNEQAGVEEAEV